MKRALLAIVPLVLSAALVLGFACGNFVLAFIIMFATLFIVCIIGVWVYVAEWIADKLGLD